MDSASSATAGALRPQAGAKPVECSLWIAAEGRGELKKKLIEVGLPLAAINEAASREKSIRHVHPSTLHLWWARRPLAACRAVLFASLVDDPSAHPEQFPTSEAKAKERERLFAIIEQLVQWKSSNDEAVLAAAEANHCNGASG